MSESANTNTNNTPETSTQPSPLSSAYTPEPDDVLRDKRTDELIRLIYLDNHVALCRVNQQSERGSGDQWVHRMDTRRAFDAQLDSGRLTHAPDAEIDAPASTQPTIEVSGGVSAESQESESEGDTTEREVDESTMRINETDWNKYASESTATEDTETTTTPHEDTEREPWSDVDNIGKATESNLYDAGYETPGDIATISDDELLTVDQLGAKGVENLREYVLDSNQDSEQLS